MGDFLNTGEDRRYCVSEWNALLVRDPAEHRAAHAEGRVDLPGDVRAAVAQNRTERRPIGFGDAESAVGYQRELQERDTLTREERRNQPPREVEEQQAAPAEPTSTERQSHAEWSKLSETDPEAAMAAHREGRVDFASHVAEQLQANRSDPGIGG